MMRRLRHHQPQALLFIGLMMVCMLFASGGMASAQESDAPSAKPPLPPRVVIPSIGVDASVTSVGYGFNGDAIGWQSVETGIGWHQSSTVPGFPGNAVFSGHNATHGDRVFRNLHKLASGDTFTIYVGKHARTYEVSERVIFREWLTTSPQRQSNAKWLANTSDERVTLITCYPLWTNSHRLVVVAHPLTIAPRGTLRAEFE